MGDLTTRPTTTRLVVPVRIQLNAAECRVCESLGVEFKRKEKKVSVREKPEGGTSVIVISVAQVSVWHSQVKRG